MELRPSVARYPFDLARFTQLRSRFLAGELSVERNRLSSAPDAIDASTDLAVIAGREADLAAEGEAALRAGKVAMLVMNGGMAMRFGGVAKGTVPVVQDRAESFLAVKLGQIAHLARNLRCRIPVAVMHSFATEADSRAHLDRIDWAGVNLDDREPFAQSVMPRVALDGTPLAEHPRGPSLLDTEVYAAPGHGDTLRRLRESGALSRLGERGVEHVLVCNVDNLGARMDARLVGAHLRAVEQGASVSVEVVRRLDGDAGGCIARVAGKPVIVEGFRLPPGTDLGDYPHFNTNTLWFALDALDGGVPLDWFAVKRSLTPKAGGEAIDMVQFEQLIGQATEHLPTRFLEVERDERFLPIKTREDLAHAEDRMRRFLAELD